MVSSMQTNTVNGDYGYQEACEGRWVPWSVVCRPIQSMVTMVTRRPVRGDGTQDTPFPTSNDANSFSSTIFGSFPSIFSHRFTQGSLETFPKRHGLATLLTNENHSNVYSVGTVAGRPAIDICTFTSDSSNHSLVHSLLDDVPYLIPDSRLDIDLRSSPTSNSDPNRDQTELDNEEEEVEIFGEKEIIKTDPIYFKVSRDNIRKSWSQYIWQQLSTHISSGSKAPSTDERKPKSSYRPTGLAWVFQRVETELSTIDEKEYSEREWDSNINNDGKEDKEDEDEDDCELYCGSDGAMNMQLPEACSCSSNEDLAPLWRLVERTSTSGPRLRFVLEAVVNSNPQISKLGTLYYAWWCAAATTRIDNYSYLISDMQERVQVSEEDIQSFVFVRPASTLGHMRVRSNESASIASVM
eukprot:Ihof_evm1s184 gene=Ihof_evmTU1s184